MEIITGRSGRKGRAALWESIAQEKPRSILNQMIMGQDVWAERPSESFRQNLLAAGVNRVLPDRSLGDAKIFFVDCEQPQPKAQWHVVLRGGTLISDTFFSNKPCFAVTYMSACLKKQARLYFTDLCKDQKSNVYDCIVNHCRPAWPQSKWDMLPDAAGAHIVVALQKEKGKFKKKRTECPYRTRVASPTDLGEQRQCEQWTLS